MSFIHNDPESLPLTSLKAMEISTSSKLPLKTIEKKNIRSHPKRISEIERMIMLNHKCNCSENCEKKCEAGKIEPADDRDKTYSLPPAPESLSLTSSNDIENPTSSQLSVDKKMANNLTQAQKKILLKDLCKRVDDRKKRREAGNLDPNDPQDIPLLCSFVPSREEISSTRVRHFEKYLELKKKQREKRPVIYQWLSELNEIEKTTKLTSDQKFVLWQKIKAQHDESPGDVPESLSLTSSNDIENPTSSQLSVGKKMANNLTEAQIDILLKDLCKRVDDRKKRREAGNLDPNDPQDIPLLCSFVPSSEEKRSFRHSEKYLEYKKKKTEKYLEFRKQQHEKRPLYYQWRSECEEIEKTTKLTYDQKFAIWRKMKVEHDKSSGE